MKMPLKKYLPPLFLALALLFLSGSVLQVVKGIIGDDNPRPPRSRESFDASLVRLDNLKKLTDFVDSLYFLNHGEGDHPAKYANLADSVVRMRFYYGLQNYSFAENFLANLAGKYIWADFGAKVIPNHILKGPKAFCSQSSIVFQELLKRKGFYVRTVELPNHFCTEVLIDGEWAFHDVSYKPNFNGNRKSMEELANNIDLLEQAYLYSFKEDFFEQSRHYFEEGNFSYGKINAFPASRMIWFHRITWFFSWFGWLFFGIFYFLVRKKQ
jgi:hypothetical protein